MRECFHQYFFVLSRELYWVSIVTLIGTDADLTFTESGYHSAIVFGLSFALANSSADYAFVHRISPPWFPGQRYSLGVTKVQ
jgi:hypothetical protein